jgi:hypothetical protein
MAILHMAADHSLQEPAVGFYSLDQIAVLQSSISILAKALVQAKL